MKKMIQAAVLAAFVVMSAACSRAPEATSHTEAGSAVQRLSQELSQAKAALATSEEALAAQILATQDLESRLAGAEARSDARLAEYTNEMAALTFRIAEADAAVLAAGKERTEAYASAARAYQVRNVFGWIAVLTTALMLAEFWRRRQACRGRDVLTKDLQGVRAERDALKGKVARLEEEVAAYWDQSAKKGDPTAPTPPVQEEKPQAPAPAKEPAGTAEALPDTSGGKDPEPAAELAPETASQEAPVEAEAPAEKPFSAAPPKGPFAHVG